MGKKDLILKKVLSDNERFASIFNNYFFNGDEVINPKELEDGNIEYTVNSEDGKHISRIRDLLKSGLYKLDGNNRYLLLGIENQTSIDKLMPFRVMLYDALTYDHQIHVAKEKKDDKIKLKPVITLVIYYGNRKRNDKLDIISNLDIDSRLKEYVSNYNIRVLSIKELTNEEISKYTKDIRQLFKYIKLSNNKEEISTILKDKDFETVKNEIVDCINVLTNSNISYKEGDDSVNMCKGLDELLKEKKQEGMFEGEKQAEEKNIKTMHSNGFDINTIAKALSLDINYVKLVLSK